MQHIGLYYRSLLIKQQGRKLSGQIMPFHNPRLQHTMRSEHHTVTFLLRPSLRQGTTRYPTTVHVYHIRTDLIKQQYEVAFHSNEMSPRTDIVDGTVFHLQRMIRTMSDDMQVYKFSKFFC